MMFTRPADSRQEPSRRSVEEHEGGWFYEGQAAERLWNKSAIGRWMGDSVLLLAPCEVLFCREHRHIEWPTEAWLSEQVKAHPRLLDEAAVLEALRVPGNRIVLHSNFEAMRLSSADTSWGLRWPSDEHPNSSNAVSEVRWFHASEEFDSEDLYRWSSQVTSRDRIPEVMVVDDEHAVVTYRVLPVEPSGSMGSIPDGVLEAVSSLSGADLDSGGRFVEYEGNWPDERIGIPHPGGRMMDETTVQMIDSKTGISLIPTLGGLVLWDLLNRGLHPRPGFKYGTRWRCYDEPLGQDHAPLLVVHPNEGPTDWEGACLASRLASGVNKTWVHPMMTEGNLIYISITRPPADSRWSNPYRR